MASMELLIKQHEEIQKIINRIEDYIKKDVVENVADIVKSISQLSGILNIHLRQEDEFIYPNLQNSKYQEGKEIAKVFIEDMCEIADSFQKYKNKFNTSRKLLNQLSSFEEETNEVFSALKNRIEKENNVLYVFLRKLNDNDFIEVAMTRKNVE